MNENEKSHWHLHSLYKEKRQGYNEAKKIERVFS